MNQPRPMTGREFTPADIEVAVAGNGLLSLELEMTAACNLRCTYCYASAGEAGACEMTLEEIRDGVRQAAGLGARKIILLGGGEPCIYPRFRELIDLIHDMGLSTELFTNGTLIDTSLSRFLYQKAVHVVVKRNSNIPSVQDALAGSPGAFHLIDNGLRCLLDAGYPDADHALGIQTVICRLNYGEVPDLWRWARRSGIHPYFETVKPQGRATNNSESLALSPAALQDIFQRLCDIDRGEFGILWTPHPPLVGSTCSRHLFSMFMKTDGTLQPCVGVEIPVGNIRVDRIADVIKNHPVIRDLRNIYQLIKGSCRTCDLNGSCYGCRAVAYHTLGDYLGADVTCWRNRHS